MCLTANAAVGDIVVPGDPKDALQVGEEGLPCDHPEMGVNWRSGYLAYRCGK